MEFVPFVGLALGALGSILGLRAERRARREEGSRAQAARVASRSHIAKILETGTLIEAAIGEQRLNVPVQLLSGLMEQCVASADKIAVGIPHASGILDKLAQTAQEWAYEGTPEGEDGQRMVLLHARALMSYLTMLAQYAFPDEATYRKLAERFRARSSELNRLIKEAERADWEELRRDVAQLRRLCLQDVEEDVSPAD